MNTTNDFTWPTGYQAAIALTFDLDAESVILAVDDSYARRPSIMTHQAYGPLVGLPRLLEILAGRGLPATFFVPGYSADRYPAAVEAILEGGHEVAHHGYLHRPPAALTPAEERVELERGLEALGKFGVRPAGFRAPWWDTSPMTMELLAEYQFVYDASLFDADVPYLLATGSGNVVEIPQAWVFDDWERYAYMPDPPSGQGVIERPEEVMETWWQEFVANREYRACSIPVMHPFLSGRPARALALGGLLDRLSTLSDVWVATMGQIAQHSLSLGLQPRPLALPETDELDRL